MWIRSGSGAVSGSPRHTRHLSQSPLALDTLDAYRLCCSSIHKHAPVAEIGSRGQMRRDVGVVAKMRMQNLAYPWIFGSVGPRLPLFSRHQE